MHSKTKNLFTLNDLEWICAENAKHGIDPFDSLAYVTNILETETVLGYDLIPLHKSHNAFNHLIDFSNHIEDFIRYDGFLFRRWSRILKNSNESAEWLRIFT